MNPIDPGTQKGVQDEADHAAAERRLAALPADHPLRADGRKGAAPGSAERIAFDRELAAAAGGAEVRPGDLGPARGTGTGEGHAGPAAGRESAQGASGGPGPTVGAPGAAEGAGGARIAAAGAPVAERPEDAQRDVRERTRELFGRIRQDVGRAGRLGTDLLAIALGDPHAEIDEDLAAASGTLLAHVPSGAYREEIATYLSVALAKRSGEVAAQPSSPAVAEGLAYALLSLRAKLDTET